MPSDYPVVCGTQLEADFQKKKTIAFHPQTNNTPYLRLGVNKNCGFKFGLFFSIFKEFESDMEAERINTQRIMRPEQMDEEVPTDGDSHSEDDSLYDVG